MNLFSLRREIRLRDLELFRVMDKSHKEPICYVLMVDMRRPSMLSDYPYLGIDSEEEFSSSGNLIRMIIISQMEIERELSSELVNEFVSIFLEHKINCDYINTFEVIDKYFDDKGTNRPLLEFLDTILEGYGIHAGLTTISEDKMSNLSQD